LTQSISAQVPSAHTLQISIAAQSLATLHSGFVGAGHSQPHWPFWQVTLAHVPSAQGLQSSIAGQSVFRLQALPHTGYAEPH
jgi:hypothetical protein